MKLGRSLKRAAPSRRAKVATRLACLAAPLLAGALALTGLLSGGASVTPAAGQPSWPTPVPQTDASVPASGVTMIGATPLEAPGTNEAWGVGEAGSSIVVVRYTKEGGEGAWTIDQTLPAGLKLARGPLAGQMTPSGAGALVGTEGSGEEQRHLLFVRKPHGAFEPATQIPTEAQALAKGEEPLLKQGEELFASSRAPLFEPLDEGGEAGALIVPVNVAANTAVEHQVLHWDGAKWTSEPIEIPTKSDSDFRVLAIGASEPGNAWLLGQLSPKSSYPAGAVALFRRVREGEGTSAKWSWKPVTAPGGKSEEAEPLTVPVLPAGIVEPFVVPGSGEQPTVTAQVLTVTSEGVWIDGRRGDVSTLEPATTTLFFKPEGPTVGTVMASWCLLPAGVPAGTPACDHELPEPLPSGPSRSIAWTNGSELGERVITGFAEGVSLSLRGESFERVLALGSGAGAEEDPGAAHGAAFTTPSEGWLGTGLMPVHLTTEPAPSRLTPWPTSFRHPLLAVASQPGAPAGSLSSEALAVGDMGAVARFKPGVGWQPESLFGVGQRVEQPRLRAIAWPTPGRAYAVGDYSSEYANMWLYRGEMGLWEPDPATPLNFRGNLLGIAFDPNNPSRGYAVGSSITAGAEGVLLRYGKTWTQESGLPPQVRGASFVSVAFAGSEALVAYRQRLSTGVEHASGGLLVNEGSGWHVDEQAGAMIGEAVPATVAGLPDGGAAFTTVGGSAGPRVYERESAGAPWQVTPTPLPGLGAGSLTLFREGGALRAIVSAGGVANEGEPAAPPPGSPPNFLAPFPPVGGGPQSGGILRQTASGWRDEGHELNPAREQPGGYAYHDLPYRPDPILAVLVNPSGSEGWAVGGNISSNQAGRLETADVERYPADGVAPLGSGVSPIPAERPAHETEKDVTFAIGGGADCAAPCADRALAGIGPDVWLRTALEHARQVAGVRAFLYTGPYVTAAKVNGPRSLPVPFAKELAEYKSILGAAGPLPVYPAISPQELNARPEREGAEQSFFEAGLSPLEPLAGEAAVPGELRQSCVDSVGCEADYYAFDSTGAAGTVRVIVLDDSSDVEQGQLEWLEGELEGAKRSAETTKQPLPAIVIGNADLSAQVAAGDQQAARVVAALVGGTSKCRENREPCGASAYFFDSPEENIKKPLRSAGESIEEIGSGTLGYVNAEGERYSTFHGAGGFLLGQVEMAEYEESTNRAPVTPRLIPDISELALEAHGGTLLRRSEPALFAGLARRPRAGGRAGQHSEETEVDPYIPIPQYCVGAGCATSYLLPEYSFSSSNPDIGAFVKPNLATPANHEAVLLNSKGEPEREVNEDGVEESTSGLFCSFNAGTTTVTISAGGLSASLPVKVEAGSVREPCGTVRLKQLPAAQQRASAPAPPPPAAAPAGAQPAPAGATPPIPLPPPPALPAARPNPPRPTLPPFVPLATVSAPLLAFVPPPVPTPARPSPPTGTSAVTSPIEVAEREEEEESATEQASNLAVAYSPGEDEPPSVYLLGVLLLAALAGASIRRPRRGGRAARAAHATVGSARAQKRLTGRSRRAR